MSKELYRAWVYNAIDNSVSVVDLANLFQPVMLDTVDLPDTLDDTFKLGRKMFNNASASSTGTFSCASCHPDGHTDQLLWVLGGPACDLPGCTQIPVRTTMPVRGLRGTAPYHWDGVPGDPFGGRNGQSPNGNLPPNCSDELSCVRHLVDGSLATTMCFAPDCPANPEGLTGQLNEQERDALSHFILQNPYPPARERPIDDSLTALAKTGFDDFFVKDATDSVAGQTCGSVGCHNMPFWSGTNIAGSGMDAPTFRGLPDRWLVLPQGRVNMVELYGQNGAKGFDEKDMWLRIISGSTVGQWQMFLEGSTGLSGAYARQITLRPDDDESQRASNLRMLSALTQAADNQAIVLVGYGVWLSDDKKTQPVQFKYTQRHFWDISNKQARHLQQLLDVVAAGDLIVTLTAYAGQHTGPDKVQPAIWSTQPLFTVTKIAFPRLSSNAPIILKGRHIQAEAHVFVDGSMVDANLACNNGSWPDCENDIIRIELASLPNAPGMHTLQVQNDQGFFSNEYLFWVNE